MKNIYFKIVNWKLKDKLVVNSSDIGYQLFCKSRCCNNVAGYIDSYVKNTSSKLEDVRMYIFESKKQYDESLREYINELHSSGAGGCVEII